MPFDDNNETPIKNVSFEEQISWNQENLSDTIALTKNKSISIHEKSIERIFLSRINRVILFYTEPEVNEMETHCLYIYQTDKEKFKGNVKGLNDNIVTIELTVDKRTNNFLRKGLNFSLDTTEPLLILNSKHLSAILNALPGSTQISFESRPSGVTEQRNN